MSLTNDDIRDLNCSFDKYLLHWIAAIPCPEIPEEKSNEVALFSKHCAMISLFSSLFSIRPAVKELPRAKAIPALPLYSPGGSLSICCR